MVPARAGAEQTTKTQTRLYKASTLKAWAFAQYCRFEGLAPQTVGITRPVSERRDGRSPDLLIDTVRCLPKTTCFSGEMAHNSQLTVAGTAPDLNRVPFSLAAKQEPSVVRLREMARKVKRFKGSLNP